MTKNLAITVLTWNDWENTVKCLESIYQSSYNYFDIVLVNNNSEKSHLNKIIDWSENKVEVVDDEIEFNSNKKIDLIEIDKNTEFLDKGKKFI